MVPSTTVDQDSGGELGHGARAGRDTATKCLSRLEPGIPIHLHSPDPPRLMVLSLGVNWDLGPKLISRFY